MNPLEGIDPERIFLRLVKAGEDWADAHAAASMLEETQKTVLSQEATAFMEAGRSAAAAEKLALASPEYRKHVEAMVAARRHANRLKVRYDSARVWAELLRSANANRRAEMALGGMTT